MFTPAFGTRVQSVPTESRDGLPRVAEEPMSTTERGKTREARERRKEKKGRRVRTRHKNLSPVVSGTP